MYQATGPMSSTTSMYQAAADQKQLLPAAVGVPIPSRLASIQLTLVQRDGRFMFPDAYSLELTGKMSREELAGIVAELNATAYEYGPNRSGVWGVLGRVPLVGIASHITWATQYQTMKSELQKAIGQVNSRYAAAGRVSLLYREVPWEAQVGNGRRRQSSPATNLPQVEVQVLGA